MCLDALHDRGLKQINIGIARYAHFLSKKKTKNLDKVTKFKPPNTSKINTLNAA